MKKLLPVLLTVVLSITITRVNATIVTVTQQGNTFAPANISVTVGDTVRWVWTSGFHTTTSSDIPTGAATWDSELSAEVPQYDYEVKVAGTYNYVCTPHIDLGMIGTITATGSLGIDDNSNISIVKIFPNPAKDHASLMMTSAKQGRGVMSIYDLLGNKVNDIDVAIKQGSNSIPVPMDKILPGIYFIELKYNNQAAIVRRFVKSR